MFDAEQFLNTPAPLGPTQFEVVPEGDTRMMLDNDPAQLMFTNDPKSQVGIKNPKGTGKKGAYDFWTLELRCIVIDEEVKKKLGRDKVTVRARINLDFDSSGQLDSTKNVPLNQLREALGQTLPDWSPKELLGAGPFIGRVRHTANPDNPEIKYADVVRFARIS